jgi:hypothetical protein
VFLKGQTPYITVNQATKEILVLPNNELNVFFTSLGLKGDDVLLSFNNKAYSLENIYDLITDSQKWKEDETIAIKIKRNGKEQVITGKVKLPYEEVESLNASDSTKKTLKDAWLKG